jgi:hypothetical protein
MFKVSVMLSAPLGQQQELRDAFINHFGGERGGNGMTHAWVHVYTKDCTPILAAFESGNWSIGQRPYVANLPESMTMEEARLVDRQTAIVWPESKEAALAAIHRSVSRSGGAGADAATATQDGWLLMAENVHHINRNWDLWAIRVTEAIDLLSAAGNTASALRTKIFAAGGVTRSSRC